MRPGAQLGACRRDSGETRWVTGCGNWGGGGGMCGAAGRPAGRAARMRQWPSPGKTAAVRRWPVPASPRQRKCGRRDVSEERYASVSRCTFSCRERGRKGGKKKKKNHENIKNRSFPPAAKVGFPRGNGKKMGASVLPLSSPPKLEIVD